VVGVDIHEQHLSRIEAERPRSQGREGTNEESCDKHEDE
jgi:hypothetical protein